VKAVKVVNDMRPSVAAALDAIRHGNGPRKAFENVLEGTQKLPHLAKSVAYYYGAKRFDGWEEWLDPEAEALDTLASESD
jgi:hypothetical protein